MNDKAKIYLLKSLRDTLESWTESVCESEEWGDVGYVGDDIVDLMASAVLLVLQANASGSKATEDNT